MRELLKNLARGIPHGGAKKIFETKKTSALARCSHTTSAPHAPRRCGVSKATRARWFSIQAEAGHAS
jgi:hypothetical protein